MAAVAATTAMVAAAAMSEAVPKRAGEPGSGSGSGGPAAPSPSPAGAAPTTTTTTTAQPTSSSVRQRQQQQKDLLDTTVAYLKQREGIDKTLKIIRYTARLVAATAPADSEAARRCERVQASLGSARKAYRLGKFLQHVSAWRRLPPLDWRLLALSLAPPSLLAALDPAAAATQPAAAAAAASAYARLHRRELLERAATLGEGAYYFLDQLAFYFKAGAFGEPDKKNKASWERRASRLSAWAESVGYACNIALGLARVRELAAAEARLRGELVARYRASGGRADSVRAEDVARLRGLRAARRLRAAAIAQDAADSLLALSDLLDGGGGAVGRAVSHPALLALCGLLSAAVSTHKNWTAVVAAG
jgi:hypothetical protein